MEHLKLNCVTLEMCVFRDNNKPINVLTGIDYWLDNLICNVPELVMCFHVNGIVQVSKLQCDFSNFLPNVNQCRAYLTKVFEALEYLNTVSLTRKTAVNKLKLECFHIRVGDIRILDVIGV